MAVGSRRGRRDGQGDTTNGDGGDAGRTGEAVVTGAQLSRLLQAQGFDLSMVAFGTTAAILTMVARLEDAKDWGPTEFFALLGFGVFQILLGFLDRTFARQAVGKAGLAPRQAGFAAQDTSAVEQEASTSEQIENPPSGGADPG